MSQLRYDIPVRLTVSLSDDVAMSENRLSKDLIRLSELIQEHQLNRIPGLHSSILVADGLLGPRDEIEVEGAIQLGFDELEGASKGVSQFEQPILVRDDILSALRLIYPGVIKSGAVWLGMPRSMEIDRVIEPAEIATLADKGYSFGERGLGVVSFADDVNAQKRPNWLSILAPWMLLAALIGAGWLAFLNLRAVEELHVEIERLSNAAPRISGIVIESANVDAEFGGNVSIVENRRAARRGGTDVETPDVELQQVQEIASRPTTRTDLETQNTNLISDAPINTPSPVNISNLATESGFVRRASADQDIPNLSTPSASITPTTGGFVSTDPTALKGGVEAVELPRIWRES